MPDSFTLTALQNTCQSILGREIDKAAFRRKLKDSPDLVAFNTDVNKRHVFGALVVIGRD